MLLAVGLAGCQPEQKEAVAARSESESLVFDTDDSTVEPSLKELAKTDHIALLERCLEEYRSRPIETYTTTFIKQEVIDGKRREPQHIDVKFRDEPFSVAMVWTKNAPLGDRLLYVEGRYENGEGVSRMLVRPKGGLARLVVGDSVLRVPTDPQAMQSTRRPVTLFGFENTIQSLLDVYRKARERGELQEKYRGMQTIDGVKCLVLQRIIPKKRDDYPAKETFIYINPETLMPRRVLSYDWGGRLESDYQYHDVNLNAGLDAEDFTPEAVGIAPPD
jgi:hypothetical protein